MSVISYRGEKNVSEIVDKQYSRLTPRQREKAEAAVLKANPQLRNISKVRQGTILRLPNMPELRKKAPRSLDKPDEQIANQVADVLSSYAERFTNNAGLEEKTIKAQMALLKSARFKKVIAEAEPLQALVKETSRALAERSKNLAEQQGQVKEAISQALAGLKEM